METTKGQFEKYVMMIRKMAHKFATKLNVPYEEMEAQGYLIYSECLKSFDISKGTTFSTHLFTNLKRLNDFGHTYNRQKGVLLEDISNEDSKKSDKVVKIKLKNKTEESKVYDVQLNYDNPTIIDLLECAKEKLSIEAFELFKWILNRDWDDFTHSKPNIKMAVEYFDTTRTRINSLWNECSQFWNNEGISLYY